MVIAKQVIAYTMQHKVSNESLLCSIKLKMIELNLFANENM